MVLYQHRFSGFFFVSLFALNLRHFVLPLQHYPQFHSRRAPPRPVLSNLQGACHQRFCACSSRSPKKSRNRRESKIENLKCTAVVLTSCSTSSVSDDNNGATDHNTSSDQPTSTRHLVNVLGFTDEKDGNSDSDSDARTVIGDLVLSDWLDVLPRSRRDSEETAHKREFPTEDHERLNLVSYVEDGSPANVRRKRTVRSSLESIEGDTEDSAPFKFQQLIQVLLLLLSWWSCYVHDVSSCGILQLSTRTVYIHSPWTRGLGTNEQGSSPSQTSHRYICCDRCFCTQIMQGSVHDHWL